MNNNSDTINGNANNISKAWAYVTIPASIAVGPISALIIIQILNLHGSVLDASYAITFGTAMTIPASYFWGKVSDIYNSRRRQIMISYLGITLALVGLLFSKNIFEIIIAYVVLNFFSIANATPLNLLVMETAQKEHWPSAFSKLQMLGGIGATVGYVIAVFASNSVSFSDLILLLAMSSIISILMANKLIYSPRAKSRRNLLVSNSFAFISRMLMHPILFVERPTSRILNKIFNLKKKEFGQANYITMLYATGFLFFFGSAILNTVYPAGLYGYGLSKSNVFLVLFVSLMLQTSTFFYSGRFVETHLTHSVIRRSLALRAICYLLIGATFFFLVGNEFLWANLILYALAAGLSYSLYYSASYSLVFRALNNIDKGSALGVFATLISIGTLTGAFLSGQLAYHYGYAVTFVVAGLLLFLTLYMFMIMPKGEAAEKKGLLGY